ncbi:MAG: site-specific integrase [Candidatus Contendobacter sp.]|nr:site-specific integrase [Candidatus Contendobacter sp.]
MSLYKRGNTWWVRFTAPNGKRVHQSAETADRTAAQEYHDTLKARLWREAKLGDRPRHTWNEAVVQWLKETSHKATHEDDISKLRWLDPYWRGWALDRLTRQEIQRIGTIKAAEASPATANRYLALIRAILIRAQRVWEWLDRVPAITLYPEPKQRIRWLTREQANRLLEELPAHLAAMARVALATGLREANVTGLLWSQVDTARAVAWIHPDQAKGRRAIPVPLNAEALAAIRAQAGAHQRYVFTFRGQPVTRASTAAWYKALARCELTDFRWHDLRHTWASWHVQAGTPLHVLQELGGWRTPAMVQRYAHLAPEHLAEHAARIAAPNLHHPKLRVVK